MTKESDNRVKQLIEARVDVDRLSANIRAEKRAQAAKGISWQNNQCKDWTAYKAARAVLHSMHEDMGV